MLNQSGYEKHPLSNVKRSFALSIRYSNTNTNYDSSYKDKGACNEDLFVSFLQVASSLLGVSKTLAYYVFHL